MIHTGLNWYLHGNQITLKIRTRCMIIFLHFVWEFFITQWEGDISYKILLWMWLRKNPILKSLKYVNTSPQEIHLYLFQCAKVINSTTGPEDPLETWLTQKICIFIPDCLGYPSRSNNQDPLCNSMSNFMTYWVHIHQTWHCGIPHTHHTLKNTPVSGIHRVGAVANESGVDNCNWICIFSYWHSHW